MIRAGVKVNAGIDLDPACAYPYEANNGGTLFVERDIGELTGTELETFFTPGAFRVLAGCAPCQPFSTYRQGHDNENDDKWGLLYPFGRLVRETLPDVVTMENVPSVARHAVFDDFISELAELDYQVWHEVVECAAYGVPQTRKRMVLLASRHGPIALTARRRRTPVTVRQAIGSLLAIEAGGWAHRDRLHAAASLSEKNLARIRASRPGGTWRDWPRRLVAECHKDETGRTYPSVYGRMAWDELAPTMTTQCFGFGNGRFGHPEQDRAISLREAAILQSFPRRYKFVPRGEPVQFSVIGRLIGNAVPVKLGEAIGKSIVAHLASAA